MTFEHMWEAIIAVLISVAGGIARLLNAKDIKAIKALRVVAETFTAAFTGGMVYLLANLLKFNGYAMCLVAGLAGWVGPKALNAIAKIAGKATGVTLEEEEKSDDKKDT